MAVLPDEENPGRVHEREHAHRDADRENWIDDFLAVR